MALGDDVPHLRAETRCAGRDQTRPTKDWITWQISLKAFGHLDEIAATVPQVP
jgi:hypothetical protein